MPAYRPAKPRRSWVPWVKSALVVGLTLGAGWGVLEFGQRHLNLQKLTIEQVVVTGCKGERLAEIQAIANEVCLGRPLFWFDADRLRERIIAHRWVRGLLIRRDPPDRLALVVEERKPVLWIVQPQGAYLMSDDGHLLDRLGQASAVPIPVVADAASLSDEAVAALIRVASRLRDHQRDFFDRVVELRWTPRGPVAFIEGLKAPLYLSRVDAAKNIPNFQGLFLDQYAGRPEVEQIRYFDLRWDDEVAVGLEDTAAPPKAEANP